ncbi:MAG: hypothetical protein KC912_12340 [Proteobacteria bacterium]|nr:hypothetical protein [Pseudomonadota bacterium]
MSEVIDPLKSHARNLHEALRAGDVELLDYVNKGLRSPIDLADVQRRHVLAAIARQLGFRGWSHLTAVLSGAESDVGTLLCPSHSFGHTNIWSANREEARAIRRQTGGYLLGWKHQFLVVQAPFLTTLGLGAADPDWDVIDRDWTSEEGLTARNRLYAKAFRHALGARSTERLTA